MLTRTQRTMASAMALGVLVLLVGTAVFLAAREDPTPPPPTTTTSTTLGIDDVADAIAASLQGDLAVALTAPEARCVAEAVVRLVPVEDLATLADRPLPLTGVAPEVRDDLVRAVVGCVPPTSAAALLGSATTTTEPVGLPGEGQG